MAPCAKTRAFWRADILYMYCFVGQSFVANRAEFLLKMYLISRVEAL